MRTRDTTGERKRKPSWLQALLYAVAIPTVLTIAARLNTHVDLGRLLEELALNWRNITHVLWGDVARLLGVHVSDWEADALSFVVLVIATQITSRLLLRFSEPAPREEEWRYVRINLWATMLVFGAFFVPTIATGVRLYINESTWAAYLIGVGLTLVLIGYLAAISRANVPMRDKLLVSQLVVAILVVASHVVVAIEAAQETGIARAVVIVATPVWPAFLLLVAMAAALSMAMRFHNSAMTRIVVAFLGIWTASHLSELAMPIAQYVESAITRASD